jgi:tetratricopeptide (TPR) repeat protein
MRNRKKENDLLQPLTNGKSSVTALLLRIGILPTIACAALLQGCATSELQPSSGAVDEAVAQVPVAAAAAYKRALEAMTSGSLTDAELELEHLVLEFPDYVGPYVNLAILYRGNGLLVEAEDVLSSALSIDPQHPVANNQLGILMRSLGRFEEAEIAYRRAIATDPSYPLAYYNLGILLDLYLRRPADALASYERYQNLMPEADASVAGWIIDLRRRVGAIEGAQRVAQEFSQ